MTYSAAEKTLHRLALGPRAVRELTFDLGRMAAPGAPAEGRDERHVFVAGLARAGTSLLLRRIYATRQFSTLTYRDMPFVLAPTLWRRLTAGSRKDGAAAERAHGDGLAVDFDSPEAFEEVFWLTFEEDAYLAADRVIPHDAAAETIDKFRLLVDGVIAAGAPAPGLRYLSKNNNNIVRLGSIAKAFPQATIICPFREPSAQARSLHRQHQRFLALSADDPFTADYMRWLGHFEFGPGHRRFDFTTRGAAPSASGPDPASADYWLALWTHVHEGILATAPDAVVFWDHDAFTHDPDGSWRLLARRIGVPANEDGPDAVRPSESEDRDGFNPALLQAADAVHRRLKAKVDAL